MWSGVWGLKNAHKEVIIADIRCHRSGVRVQAVGEWPVWEGVSLERKWSLRNLPRRAEASPQVRGESLPACLPPCAKEPAHGRPWDYRRMYIDCCRSRYQGDVSVHLVYFLLCSVLLEEAYAVLILYFCNFVGMRCQRWLNIWSLSGHLSLALWLTQAEGELAYSSIAEGEPTYSSIAA